MYVCYVLVWYAAVLLHIIQEHNTRTSTEFNLVTAQSTALEPSEDGRKYGPKHVGVNF
jgi:hypothetical protein